jgi:predicted dehydrogenase
MKLLICGTGSIGRRHACNGTMLGCDVSIWSANAQRAQQAAVACNARLASANLAQAASEADAILIATATDQHVDTLKQVAQTGKPLYLEKPICHTDKALTELRQMKLPAIIEIGCQLRSHPGLIVLSDHLRAGRDGPILSFRAVVGQRLDAWRPNTNHLQSYSADANRGGGALFDLIHEIDLAIWLLGDFARLTAQLVNISDLGVKGDDLTQILFQAKLGAPGSLEMDMLCPVYRRSCEIICAKSRLLWDYPTGVLTRETSAGRDILYQQPSDVERNALFVSHLSHFLERAQNESLSARCGLDDGLHAVEVALSAREASHKKSWVEFRGRQ